MAATRKARNLTEPSRAESLLRERRRQIRGLIVLAALILLWVLYRADRAAIFHPGWWRI